MDVAKILALIPSSKLEELAMETKVNKYSKKLQGEVVFKLLIYSILSYKDNSLRTMESAFESITFKLLNGGQVKQSKIRYSSISERLSTINVDFFEQLYTTCVAIYSKEIGDELSSIVRFDSTIVSLSSHLLHVGYQLKGGDAAHVRQVKFTVGLSEIPTTVHFFTEQKHTSENVALKESIINHTPLKADVIRVFDKGITSRKTYDELEEKNVPFISRINVNSKYELCQPNVITSIIETPTLHIFSDEWIYLFTSDKRKTTKPFRCIRALIKENQEPIAFISNIPNLSSTEITELYKRRWDIEVFFKFLKQELNFSHLINRSENGIRVMLFATLIAAILLLVYKKKNKLTGYKIMKQKFVNELEKLIARDIVIMCDGKSEIFDKYFGISPP